MLSGIMLGILYVRRLACTDYVAPKMVNEEEFIKKAYDWLESHTDLRKEDLDYFVEYMKG